MFRKISVIFLFSFYLLTCFVQCYPITEKNRCYITNILREIKVLKQNESINICNSYVPRNASVRKLGNKEYEIQIDEGWFNKLSVPEKRFLIGHEGMHIKYQHEIRQLRFNQNLFRVSNFSWWAILLGLEGACSITLYNFIMHNQHLSDRTKGIASAVGGCATAFFLGVIFDKLHWGVSNSLKSKLHLYYSRKCEKQADIQACKALNFVDGGIALCERWKNDEKGCFYKYDGKGTHPTYDERICYLKKLKNKKLL